jgi:hypothetical protein
MATDDVKIMLYDTTEMLMKCEASITVETVLENLKKFGPGVIQNAAEVVLNSKRELPSGIFFFSPAGMSQLSSTATHR